MRGEQEANDEDERKLGYEGSEWVPDGCEERRLVKRSGRWKEGEIDWVEVGGEVVSVIEAGEVVKEGMLQEGLTPSVKNGCNELRRFLATVSLTHTLTIEFR